MITHSNTKTAQQAVKCLVYGESGVGKTRLTLTCPTPIIISSEKRLLSLKDAEIPVIKIDNHKDLYEAYNLLTGESNEFETILVVSRKEWIVAKF